MKPFQCKMCGTCCYGKGGISLYEDEIERIANFLETTPESFIVEFCNERYGQPSIGTGPDKFCIFFENGKGCRIHSVKPGVCSRWPFYNALLKDEDSWEMAKDACPGLNPECSFEDFLKQSRE